MRHNEIFNFAHWIVEMIFQVWEPNGTGPLALGDHRANMIDQKGRRVDRGFVLVLQGYKPDSLITPIGEWNFAGSNESEPYERLGAYNDLAVMLHLEECSLFRTDQGFAMVVTQIDDCIFPWPTIGVQIDDYHQEIADEWQRLTQQMLGIPR